MTTTTALVVTRNGGPEVLEVQQREVREPGAGEVRVRVEACGVNFIDVYQREGVYPIPTPFVVGSEGAGVVESLGEGVAGVAVGDRVAWAMQPGTFAGLAVLPAAALVPVPEGVDLETAAAAMLQGMTAHYLVTSTYAVQPGDTVLVHAAAGGVGQLLVQMAKARGATVIGTAGTDAKAEKARALGADHVINYSEVTDVAAAVRELTGGRGVDVVYDGVGKDTFEGSLASLRPRGMLALFGAASGQVPPFDLQRLNPAGSLFVTRPTLGHYVADREELLWRGGEVLDAIAAGRLHLEVGGRYPLADAGTAYRDLEGRRTTGKLLLIP
ncbi:quinone oxidoreductase [Oryzihumus sp.]|jgi:NADPH2:quinone reductase|uniref:quinone oxidoreductase family protein n=1 Tax=Oryzihumus sp. TaxID=1968903 RepID=UPI002EDA07FC